LTGLKHNGFLVPGRLPFPLRSALLKPIPDRPRISRAAPQGNFSLEVLAETILAPIIFMKPNG
jgi:hypothetical protein